MRTSIPFALGLFLAACGAPDDVSGRTAAPPADATSGDVPILGDDAPT
jgi:hypothetical protein